MERLSREQIDTPLGDMWAVSSTSGLVYLGFLDQEKNGLDDFCARHGLSYAVTSSSENSPVAKALEGYFNGIHFPETLSLDLRGTDFQIEVWRSLTEIPFGKTVSYAQQAESLGRSSAIRAVAAANGLNPISILLPCHRVVGSGGALTGYAGGLERKRQLLDHEARSRGRAEQPSLFDSLSMT